MATDYDADLRRLLAGTLPPPPLERPCHRGRPDDVVLSRQDFDDLVARAELAESWEAEYDGQVARAAMQHDRADAAEREMRQWRGHMLFWCVLACGAVVLSTYLWGRI